MCNLISGNGPRRTCNGDSGGALAVLGVQVGVVSFGNTDCTLEEPSVFVRVSKYTDWLKANSDINF